ncbi:acetate--CoA ligase family protein [Ottowia thiooxydans]|uniref:Acyl-CoA synthetase (NDP forming) n=1 Tax=Ottowia thiooxydans TaxID=219182 RepID=A0ABV2QA73_9BURK
MNARALDASSLRDPGLLALMAPASVAVVGASSDPGRIGGRPINWMLRAGYQGEIYPINPARAEVQGLRSYDSVAALPHTPDAAIVAVPAPQVVGTLEALGEKGVRAAVVLSSGFAEVPGEGAALQQQLLDTARRHGMRMLGPNCLGLFNANVGWYATFTTAFESGWPRAGRIGVVSQSGAFGSHLVCLARDRGMGTPFCVTTGNQADITVGEIIHWYAQDPEVDVIAAYVEGVTRADVFVEALAAAQRARKPVVMLKVGRSAIGHRAAQSHTASVAGNDVVTDAVLREFGVARVRSVDELLDVAYMAALKTYPLRNTLGVASISGGVGVLISDIAEDEGMAMPPMPLATQKRLLELLPYASPVNPVDCTAQALNDPTLVRSFTRAMVEEGQYTSVLSFYAQLAGVPPVADRLMEDLAVLRQEHPDRLFVVSGTMTQDRQRAYDASGLAVLEDPVRAARAIAAMGRLGEAFERSHSSWLPEPAVLTLPRGPMSEAQAKQLLAEHGVDIAPEQLCADVESAVHAARSFGWPVVLKIVSPDIAHKTEMGGVLMGVGDEEAVRSGFDLLLSRAKAHVPNASIEGVLVARQMQGGVECLMGIQRDPVFGPMAVFGLGGIFVELLNDVVLRRCPFNEEEAERMVRSIRSVGVLDGMRSRPPVDVPALARMLSRLSVFAHHAGDQLESVDLNPVLALPLGQGAYALDALVQTCSNHGKETGK